MDATRLAVVTAAALGAARTETDVVREAWQAHALARAVGGVLAATGPPAARAEARRLWGAGGTGVPPCGPPRASRLTSVADPPRALDVLGTLLEEAARALVPLAAAAEESETYTDCMETIEALGNCRDAVGVLRRLCVAEEQEATGEEPGGEEGEESRRSEGGGGGGGGGVRGAGETGEGAAEPEKPLDTVRGDQGPFAR